MTTPKTAEEAISDLIKATVTIHVTDVSIHTNDLVDKLRDFIDIRSRSQAIAFAEWKDRNYTVYQMQEGKYYHIKDLLKHISEATVYTTTELYDGPYQQYLIEQAKQKEI